METHVQENEAQEVPETEENVNNEDEEGSPSDYDRENCFKSVSDNKDIAKLASLISTSINSNKRVSWADWVLGTNVCNCGIMGR